jgi:uncharacterized repeat protein (TIGR01451 family)
VSAQSPPDLSISKAVNDASVRVGDDVVFTIQVKNNKGLDEILAQNVVVTDKLPSGLRPYTDRWSITPPVGDEGETLQQQQQQQPTAALITVVDPVVKNCSQAVHTAACCMFAVKEWMFGE